MATKTRSQVITHLKSKLNTEDKAALTWLANNQWGNYVTEDPDDLDRSSSSLGFAPEPYRAPVHSAPVRTPVRSYDDLDDDRSTVGGFARY